MAKVSQQASLAEKLNEIGEAMAALGELFTEASALYDAASAKSGTASDDGATGTVSGRGRKAGAVAPKKGVDPDDDDDLPPAKPAAGKKPAGKKAKKEEVTEDDVREMAKQLIEKLGNKAGKAKVLDILGGKLAEVDEDDYADKYAELKAAVEEDGEADDDDV